MSIQSIDATSIHRLTSGQVVTDLQTCVKELVENSLDAGATNIEVRFKNYGLASVEVIDNGSGIAPADYDSVALKHHTSKLHTFDDIASVRTFGFRGEALSSLCALCESLTMHTATETEAPMGTVLEFDTRGRVKNRSGKAARQRGTTVTLTKLFAPLPVRRKDLEKNAKREFGKALNLLHAYALVPCSNENGGVRLTVSNQLDAGGRKMQFQTKGNGSIQSATTALWGPKAMDNIVPLDISFDVEVERSVLKRLGQQDAISVQVKGFISKFMLGCGRQSSDRQFLFVNGRPCNLPRLQKAITETYRQFNATQTPVVIADVVLPTNTCDINVSPDKRTIFLQNEANLIATLKETLEKEFAASRSTYTVNPKPSLVLSQVSSRDKMSEDEDEDESDNDAHIAATSHAVAPAERVLSPAVSSPLPMQSTQEIDTDSEDLGTHRSISRVNSTEPEITSTTNAVGDDVPLFLPDEGESEDEREYDKSHMGHPTAIASTSKGSLPTSNKARTPSPSPPDSHSDEHLSVTPIKPAPPPNRPHLHQSRASGLFSQTSKANGTLLSYFGASSKSGISKDQPIVSCDSDKSSEPPPVKRPRIDESHPASSRKSSPLLQRPSKRLKPASPEPEPETHDTSMEDILSIQVDELMEEDHEEVPSDQTLRAAKTNPRSLSQRTFTTSLVPSHADIIDLTDAVASPPSSHARVTASQPESVDNDVSLTISINTDTISAWWKSSAPASEQIQTSEQASNANTGGVDVPTELAEEILSRNINKTDFSRMQVLGQFNLGFIIARLTSEDDNGALNDDLFIIDQHASDEKFNFETLRATTKMETQRLLRPRPLDLTAADELLAIERLDILRQNGFDLLIDEDAPAHQRVKLVAIPVSKNTAFGVEDLEELIHLLHDSSPSEMVRCSKVRTVFAMRACRKSVMIGDALTMRRMKEIVSHMGTMDQPWNCPHGRPTMRHLYNLNLQQTASSSSTIDWNTFMSQTR